MTAPKSKKTSKGSAFPVPVDDLLPAARKLAVELGAVPSQNKLKDELKIGKPKAKAVREALLESGIDLPVVSTQKRDGKSVVPAGKGSGHRAPSKLRLVTDTEPAPGAGASPPELVGEAGVSDSPADRSGVEMPPASQRDGTDQGSSVTRDVPPTLSDESVVDHGEPGLKDVAATAQKVFSGAAIRWLSRAPKQRQARKVPVLAKLLAGAAAVVSTGAALAISYVETAALGQAAGLSHDMSLLLPLCADGLLLTGVITAAVRMIRGEKAGVRPILALVVGGSAAIAANVAARHFGVDGPNPQALWGWIPPLMAGYVPVAAALAAEQALALIRAGGND